MKSQFRNDRRTGIWQTIKSNLAHHPHCEYFTDHVFTINNVKVCRGCSTFYLSSLLSILLIWFIPQSFFNQDPNLLLIIVIAIGLPSILHILVFRKINLIKTYSNIVSRVFLGFGIGFIIRYIIAVTIIYKVIGIILVSLLFVFLSVIRGRYYWKECDKCEYLTQREITGDCPGLNNGYNNLVSLPINLPSITDSEDAQ